MQGSEQRRKALVLLKRTTFPPMPVLDYPHISKSPGDVARLEQPPRVRVAQIAADHLGNGWPAEVHAALGYYFDHREEIDAELADELDQLDRAASRPPSTLRARLLAIRRSRAA